MTIITRYSIAQKVWVMTENKPVEMEVHDIQTDSSWNSSLGVIQTSTKYRLMFQGNLKGSWDESSLFPSKENLIASL